jgi:Flp pilus assembly protein TadG
MGPLGHLPTASRATDARLGARTAAGRSRARARGQMLVLFVMSIFVLTGITAIVVDISWYWANTLRVQRAADAAALAGVVWLPGAPGSAYSTAQATATQNGYTNGVGGVTVYPIQDATNNRRLFVTITAPVNTFFMKIFGIQSLTASRQSKAEYVLPVPMGSPENYYGNFGLTRNLTETSTSIVTTTTTTTGDTGWKTDTATPAGTPWTASSGTLIASVQSNNNVTARTSTNNAYQQWSTYGFLSGGSAIPNPGGGQVLTIEGIQVLISDSYVSASCANSKINVDLSWDNGGNWSTVIGTPNLGTNTSSGDYTLPSSGGSTSTAAWGPHSWGRNDFNDSNFRIRLTAAKGCATAGTTLNLDQLQVRVYWSMDTTTSGPVTTTTTLPDKNLQGPGSGCTTGVVNCYEADGPALNPRGFWATMNTEGAANVNGDAFQPYYDNPTSSVAPACSVATGDRACYDADNYYNYAVEMPAGTTNGSVYVYDPVFCAVSAGSGTGDRWFGGSNGVSSYFELYNTQNTLYDVTDDTQVSTSGTLFQQVAASDTTMGGSGGSECKYLANSTYGDGRDYHDRWYRMYSGLTGGPSGTVYRLHTTSTDPNNVAQQRNTNGESSFALYASATGGTPRVYGLGAMQMFTPLSASGGSTFSEFYLAQIDAVHAGKTVEIKLWDPGDTSPLSANLQIEIPTASGWSPTTMDYTAAKGTTNSGATNCDSTSGTGVTSIVTSTPTSRFNGCWLTIDVVIPISYTAPQSGWWKIKYNMSGSGTSNDVTTWKVQIRGNPVHLIVP